MIMGIHQPHFFPWLGFLDKVAKSDKFVILDQVQLEKGSQMIRNRVLDTNGNIKYLTISADTKDFLGREYRSIKVRDKDVWIKNQKNALLNYYRRAKYFDEAYTFMEEFYRNDFGTLFEWVFGSVKEICRILSIDTPFVLQSEIEYDRDNKKSDMVMEICKTLSADTYLSGCGGSSLYLDREKFRDSGIEIRFQTFVHPVYQQCQTSEFVAGLSVIDALFNCGMEGTKILVWEKSDKDTGNEDNYIS